MSIISSKKKYYLNLFIKKGIENAIYNIEEIFIKVLGLKDTIELYFLSDVELKEDDESRIENLVNRRLNGVPLQYILGFVDFFNCRFRCDNRALIPRPETEEIAFEVFEHIGQGKNLSVLELGCGSGAFSLSLLYNLYKKKQCNFSKIVLSDISDLALELAKENTMQFDFEKNISFVESDLFEKVQSRYDVILANLPYLSEMDFSNKQRELNFEPKRALLGGKDGPEVIFRFLESLSNYVKSEGLVVIEHGFLQGDKIVEKAKHLGFINSWQMRDITGINRAVFIEV